MKKIILLTFIIFSCTLSSFASNTESLNIESQSAILVHMDTGQILYEKAAYEKMYPASITKIMTAILVLESGIPLTDTAIASYDAVMTVPARICVC